MAKIVINQERCKSCQFCIKICSKNLIEIDSNKINILGYHPARFNSDGDSCTGCKLCAEICPDIAIEVYK